MYATLIDCPIHAWFELSYAQYLTVPRSVLQAMPDEWKGRFARCLRELDRTIEWRPEEGTRYYCKLMKEVEVVSNDDDVDYLHRKIETTEIEDKFMNYRYPIKMPFTQAFLEHGRVITDEEWYADPDDVIETSLGTSTEDS